MLNNNYFNLYLVRHGKSTVNEAPDIIGQSSTVKLSETGIKQAQALKTKFEKDNLIFDYAYSSTYTRAFDTAKLSLPLNKRISASKEIREYSSGDWLGCSRAETITDAIKTKLNLLNSSFQPPNGESLNEVQRRASKWLDDEIVYNKFIMAHADDLLKTDPSYRLNVIVFSHGLTIKCLLQYIMGFDKSFIWRIAIDNASICKLSFGQDGWKLHSINDTGHLTDLK